MTDFPPDDPSRPDLAPGDEAPPGTEGAGEDICPVCAGSGRSADDGPCPSCAGRGTVVTGVGGA